MFPEPVEGNFEKSVISTSSMTNYKRFDFLINTTQLRLIHFQNSIKTIHIRRFYIKSKIILIYF